MKYQHRVVGMVALLSVITYLDRVCIAVAGPRMQDDLGIRPEMWGWVTSAFFLSYSAFEIPSGALGDRIGPRKVLTRIVVWWSAFTSLTGAVTSYPILLLVRFCFGMGEAGAYPNISIVIGRWMPAATRARAWGVVWMTAQIGGAISPLLVVPIQMRYGWQASFYVFGVLGVVWAVAWYAWFRDWPTQKAGVSARELADIGTQAPSSHSGVPWGRALRSVRFWRIALLAICSVYSIAFFQSWLQTYLVRGRGYTEAALVLSSLPYIVGAGANALGGFGSDWLVRRFDLTTGRRTVGALGMGIAAVFMTATMLTSSGGLALVFLSLAYAGLLMQQPNLSAICLDTNKNNPGAVFGFMNSAGAAASSISSIVFGYIVAYSGSYDAPFVPMVALLCIGVWAWLQVEPEHQLFEEDHPAAAAVVTA
jgi:MFS transporter, ACS family, glucarate transporter